MDLLRTLDEKGSPGRVAVGTGDVQNDVCHRDGFVGALGAPIGPGHTALEGDERSTFVCDAVVIVAGAMERATSTDGTED